MILLRTVSGAPVPQVFAFELGDANPIRSAYVLLEFVPGNTAMDEARRHDKPAGQLIPSRYQQPFFRSMATAHVGLAARSNGQTR